MVVRNFDIEEFKKDWKDGQPMYWLVRKYNFASPNKVKRLAKVIGLSSRIKLTICEKFLAEKNNADEFSKLYLDSTVTVKEIARYFEFPDVSYVSRMAKELNIPSRKGPIEKFSQKKDEFIELWNTGASMLYIAKKLDISLITVQQWRKKLKLTPRTGAPIQKQLKLIQRLEAILKDSKMACSLRDLDTDNKISKNAVKKILKLSTTFDFLVLELGNPVSAKWQDSDFFGKYRGDTLVFFRNFEESLIFKLAQIISTSELGKPQEYSKEKNIYLVKLLFRNHRHLETFQDDLFNLVVETSYRYSFFSALKTKVPTFSAKLNNNSSSKNRSAQKIRQILLDSSKTKFFGCQFSTDLLLDKMANSSRQEQLNLLENLFCAMNFLVFRGGTDSFYDLKIESDTVYYVKSMVYQTISNTELLIYLSNLIDKSGIIISFQNYDKSLDERFSAKIAIFTRDDLRYLLNNIPGLPPSENSIARIMFGNNREELALVTRLDFEKSIAHIMLLSDNNESVCKIGSLKQVFSPVDDTERGICIAFISKLRKITNGGIISTISLTNINLIRQKTRYFPNNQIMGIVSTNLVSITIPNKQHMVGTDSRPSGIGYCRSLLSCDCMYWADQSKDFGLCEHLASFMFFLWNLSPDDIQQIFQFDKTKHTNIWRAFVDFLLAEIYFLIRTSPLIEQFWIDNVEYSKFPVDVKSTIHLEIKNLVEQFCSKDKMKLSERAVLIETKIPTQIRKVPSLNLDIRTKLIQQIRENRPLMDAIAKLDQEQKERILHTFDKFWLLEAVD